MTQSRQPWIQWAATAARELRAELLRYLSSTATVSPWPDLQRQFAEACGSIDVAHFADSVAQAVTCVRVAAALDQSEWASPSVRRWVWNGATPLVRQVLTEARWLGDARQASPTLRCTAQWPNTIAVDQSRRADGRWNAGQYGDALVYFFEEFLHAYDETARQNTGVFYTPPSLVRFVVRNTHRWLQTQFELADGLADTSSWADVVDQPEQIPPGTPPDARFVRLLDPAMGTGAFLLAALATAYEQFEHAHRSAHRSATAFADAWTEFVEVDLLPNLLGHELLLAPVVLAHLLVARQLAQTPYTFARPQALHLVLTDTLSHPPEHPCNSGSTTPEITVVVGNPPFSGISARTPDWIDRLLHGRDPDGRQVASYFDLADGPLAARKHWLHDDYVKFLRLAHWHIERANMGLVGFVTNHGYLDNQSFRALRYQLHLTFPEIAVIDLHGNRRRRADGHRAGRDEGVFPIGQGVAITLLSRPAVTPARRNIRFGEMWGPRAAKLAQLDSSSVDDVATAPVVPDAPFFLLRPHDTTHRREYESGMRLPDAMPVNSTVPVTARDSFVVAFEHDELRQRVRDFCDLRIPDDAIRAKYFHRTRSRKYRSGDTRGWKLATARHALAQMTDWEEALRPVEYRPFDQRWICWLTELIDWPRLPFMRYAEIPNNWALIARRQAPTHASYDFFWATSTLTVDGVIRSDHRGSESLFPLYADAERCDPQAVGKGAMWARANFSSDFVARFGDLLQAGTAGIAATGMPKSNSPADLLAYIIALFHSPTYRTRYGELLPLDFPRVLVPATPALFQRLSAFGTAILRNLAAPTPIAPKAAPSRDLGIVEPGYPKHTDATIWINRQLSFGGVPESLWHFHVGAHQVCQKYWKDRRGREVTVAECVRFRTVVAAIRRLQQLSARIDKAIATAGPWPRAFRC